MTSVVCSVILMMAYFVVINMATGSFFQRFYAIRNGSYFNPCSYDLLPFSKTINRITSALWMVFIRSGLFFLITFSLAAISKRRIKDMFRITGPGDFFPMVLILGLLCANFMTTSPMHYVPMCEDPRHYLFLIPVAAIVASKGIFLFFENPKPFFLIPVLFFVTFGVARNQHFENPWVTYLPLGIVTLIALVASFARINLVLAGVLAVAAVSFAHPVQSFLYAREAGYRFQKQIVRNNIVGRKDSVVVITNTVERNYGNYYLGFDTSRIIFKSFDDVKHQGILPDKKIFLLLDGFSNTMSGKSWEDLPAYAKQTNRYTLADSIGCAELFEIKPENLK